MVLVMKLPLASALLFVLPVASSSAQATSTYTSDDLHFTFSYPAFVQPSPDLKPPTPPAQRAIQGTAAVLDCASIPLVAQRDGGERDFDLLMLNRFDFTCGKSAVPTTADLRQAATQTAIGPLTRMEKQNVSPAIAYKLKGAGADAVYVRASATDTTHTIYTATTCTLVQSSLFCWTAVSSSPSHRAAMLAGPIRFGGQPAKPLVPATVFAQGDR